VGAYGHREVESDVAAWHWFRIYRHAIALSGDCPVDRFTTGTACVGAWTDRCADVFLSTCAVVDFAVWNSPPDDDVVFCEHCACTGTYPPLGESDIPVWHWLNVDLQQVAGVDITHCEVDFGTA